VIYGWKDGVWLHKGEDRSGRSWLLRPRFEDRREDGSRFVKRTLFGKLYPDVREPWLRLHTDCDNLLADWMWLQVVSARVLSGELLVPAQVPARVARVLFAAAFF
jgi:hypothetical protein